MTNTRYSLVGAGANLLTLPPAALHELAHVLVVLPWAARVGVVFDVRGADARVEVQYRESVPQAAVTVAHYAPLISGLLVGAAAGLWLLATGVTPTGPVETIWWCVLGVWWLVYTLPSAEDRDTEVSTDA